MKNTTPQSGDAPAVTGNGDRAGSNDLEGQEHVKPASASSPQGRLDELIQAGLGDAAFYCDGTGRIHQESDFPTWARRCRLLIRELTGRDSEYYCDFVKEEGVGFQYDHEVFFAVRILRHLREDYDRGFIHGADKRAVRKSRVGMVDTTGIRLCVRRAVESLEWACATHPDLLPDPPAKYSKHLFELIRTGGCPAYEDDGGTPRSDSSGRPIKVPSFESWKRYLREGLGDSGAPRASPRAGREHGRSIVNRQDID